MTSYSSSGQTSNYFKFGLPKNYQQRHFSTTRNCKSTNCKSNSYKFICNAKPVAQYSIKHCSCQTAKTVLSKCYLSECSSTETYLGKCSQESSQCKVEKRHLLLRDNKECYYSNLSSQLKPYDWSTNSD